MDFRKNLPFKSYGVQYANELELAASRFRALLGPTKREGQLPCRMLLQRLATGATGVKQARYRQGPTRAAKHSYVHAQYTLRV